MTVTNPLRVIVGLCPGCRHPVVVQCAYGTWPLATCPCEWVGGVDELAHAVVAQHGELRPVRQDQPR